MLKRIIGALRARIFRVLPNYPILNYLCVMPMFAGKHGRLPRNPRRKDATFYDFIFYRMIRNAWNPLEIAVVDKEYAKVIASGLSGTVLNIDTLEVVEVKKGFGVKELTALCRKYAGKKVVIKPTHNSGGILFLKDGMPAPQAMKHTLRTLKHNYFHAMRETQYQMLKPKLIVEADVSVNGVVPLDYKFFCSNGKVLYCQLDSGRFADHRRELFVVPSFKRLNVEFNYPQPDKVSAAPKKFKEMLAIAEELSRPFEFVRIDLYEGSKGIMFGEFTLTPGCALDRFSDEALAIKMMGDFKKAMDE